MLVTHAVSDAAAAPRVDSEVGRLHGVITYRPDAELQDGRIADRARLCRQHDALTAALVGEGVEVHCLGELLPEVLMDPVARAWLIDRSVTDEDHEPARKGLVRDYLHSLTPKALTHALIGGVTKVELALDCPGLRYATAGADDFVLLPLPDHRFVRDSTCWIFDGVSLNSMARRRRRRETLQLAAVYYFHQRFEGEPFPVWFGADEFEYDGGRERASIEGGDILVAGNGVVLVGVGPHTSAQAVERLSAALFSSGSAKQVLAIEIPRPFTHLDTALAMVDRDTFLVHPDLDETQRCWSVRPGDGPDDVFVERTDGVQSALRRALGDRQPRVIPSGGDEPGAVNVLPLSPGVVVAHGCNVRTNAALESAGIDVIPIAGTGVRDRNGGPRALTCPIERSAS